MRKAEEMGGRPKTTRGTFREKETLGLNLDLLVEKGKGKRAAGKKGGDLCPSHEMLL